MTAIHTAAAAVLCGLSPATFRRAMQRARRDGQDFRRPQSEWPDSRTPLWDEAKLTEWLAARRRIVP